MRSCRFWLPFFLAGLVFFASKMDAAPRAHPQPQRVTNAPGKPKISAAAKAAAEAGLAAFAENDLEGARRNFETLLQLAPNNLTGLVNLGAVKYRLGQPEEAEKLLQRAVHINPDAGLAWLTLGVVYNDENKLEAALAALSQAVLLEPKNARAHNAFADTLWRKGWASGAEEELQKTLELEPNFPDAHYNLAISYLRHAPPAIELARRHYQKALDLGAAPDPEIEKQLSRSAH